MLFILEAARIIGSSSAAACVKSKEPSIISAYRGLRVLDRYTFK